MSNFSNFDHHRVSNAEQQPPQHNAFFNDNAFNGGSDGFLNHAANESFDQNWGFNMDQYNAPATSSAGWPGAGSQQHMQQSTTFRPGARPDQVFSPPFANNFANNAGNVGGYGANAHNFAGYAQQQYGSSTISPANLSNQARAAQSHTSAHNAFGSSGNTIAPEALQSRPYVTSNSGAAGPQQVCKYCALQVSSFLTPFP